MGKKSAIYVLLTLLILTLLYCEKDKTGIVIPVIPDSIPAPIPDSIPDFPNTQGSKWTYAVFDSVTMTNDTLVITIDGTTTFQNREIAIWKLAYTAKLDTKYVFASGDTVKIYDNLNYPWQNTTFIFPLEVGSIWSEDGLNDTSRVIAAEPVTVPAGSFSRAFLIKRQWAALNSYGQIWTWLVPKVGIVRKYHREYGFGFANRKWELLSYDIKGIPRP